jgi:dTDP-4-amino-4,6-dideoxygalactose transaminase
MLNIKNMPAVLGGAPVFCKVMPFAQPTLPKITEVFDEFDEIFTSKNITNGKYVMKFEEMAAHYLNVKHAVAVSSCTSGLMLVMRALGLKGEAIAPSFTFSATVQALIWNGLKPVLADCDAKSFNIDVNKISGLINEKTSAIVGVHIFGMPCNVAALDKIAKDNRLKLIFDAAHAFGSIYHNKNIGGCGDAEVFSLSPTKVLVAGEGGIVSTNNSNLAELIKIGRDYANPGDYNCRFPGLNARMAEMNAVIAIKNLESLDSKVARRNELVSLYKQGLAGIPGISFQEEAPGLKSTYKDLSIMISPANFGLSRDDMALCLEVENIKTKKYYSPPVHRQNVYMSLFPDKCLNLAVTNYVSEHILSLPIYTHMSEEDIEKICFAVRKIYFYRKKIFSFLRGRYEGKLLPDLAGVI